MYNLEETYKKDYFERGISWKEVVYKQMAEVIYKHLPAPEVVDVGGGTGIFAKHFPSEDFTVIDGSSNSKEAAVVNPDKIIVKDLRTPFESDSPGFKLYPLAVSIEVAEHLEPEYADIFVDNLTSLSDCILMTAAPPGQNNPTHYNLKPKSYWRDKFSKKGFVTDPVEKNIVNELKNKIPAERKYLYENMMVFSKKEALQ